MVLTAAVIAVAILASFGPTLFSSGAPRVSLPPAPQPSAGTDPAPGDMAEGHPIPVVVSVDTVQNIIASLDRPVSYTRTLTLDTFVGERQYTAYARVSVDGPWTQVELDQQNKPKGIQHTIVGEDRFYRWYGDETAVADGPADQWDADLAQRIPSYQDIVDLDKSSIADTGYEERDGVPCIYVDVAVDELGYSERYWVSASGSLASSGLLMACETWKNGALVLRMTSSAPESPLPEGTLFALPDGTALHRAGEV